MEVIVFSFVYLVIGFFLLLLGVRYVAFVAPRVDVEDHLWAGVITILFWPALVVIFAALLVAQWAMQLGLKWARR
jgi:uncharacterized membrane protein